MRDAWQIKLIRQILTQNKQAGLTWIIGPVPA
ncbi:hypothetical protein CJA_2022 [Cellvibrio japonicus Ueda107]|uniref:Uncharacterized protein n=1 Tax=Cellvibrio japonicus (strain Ueda107) TaxID=498211 RepID=B3PHM1_CELJU|nr:hypothetical protein CJA_2022 [Cellvibrio japonicus Ueda107]